MFANHVLRHLSSGMVAPIVKRLQSAARSEVFALVAQADGVHVGSRHGWTMPPLGAHAKTLSGLSKAQPAAAQKSSEMFAPNRRVVQIDV